jgi:hypothetical protein
MIIKDCNMVKGMNHQTFVMVGLTRHPMTYREKHSISPYKAGSCLCQEKTGKSSISITPCKRSAVRGNKTPSTLLKLRSSSTHYGVEGACESFHLGLRFAYPGLSKLNAYGVIGFWDYADKKRLTEWLSKPQSNSAEVGKSFGQRFNSPKPQYHSADVRKLFNRAAKIVQSFENAKF